MNSKPFELRSIMKLGIHQSLIYLSVDIILYLFLLIVVNSQLSGKLWNKTVNKLFGKQVKYEKWDIVDRDELVEEEKQKVMKHVWHDDEG